MPFVLLLLAYCISPVRAGEMVVEDIFGRRLNEHGLILVDWDGRIANPAIRFFVGPPQDASFPARATLTCNEPRVYFNLPSTIGPRGPRKVVEFKKWEKLPVFVSIFPDRKREDLDIVVELRFDDANGRSQGLKLPCHVRALEEKDHKPFPITVDFSQDRTGFFKDEEKRRVVRQAAEDWSYYFETVPLEPVAAGREQTFVWDDDGWKTGHLVLNSHAYTGYVVYAYGIHTAELRSGGEPSRTGSLQSRKLPIHRSGGLEVETHGNYNTNGWLVSLAPEDFWQATNLAGSKNDLFSIAHHEMGHSLIFNPANPLFERAKKMGKLEDPAIKRYLGTDLKIDRADHLSGAVDPISRRGAFGNEFHGDMPLCRWQITKLDLLCAKAIGYPVRATSAFAPLQLLTKTLREGVLGKKYEEKIRAAGGIPFYNWELTEGLLPPGLQLDSFSGAITGIPAKVGVFDFTVRVRDYDEKTRGLSRKLRLEMRPG
jgi:hypothetical protein